MMERLDFIVSQVHADWQELGTGKSMTVRIKADGDALEVNTKTRRCMVVRGVVAVP